MREEYRKQRPLIKEAFKHLGILQYEAEGYEADDLAGHLASKFNEKDESPNLEAVMITGDKDWLQLVGNNVKWISNHDNRVVTKAGFKKETGCDTPAQFLQLKALAGDSSDAITGVGGIGETVAPRLMNHFGSVQSMLKAHKEVGEFTKENLPEELARSRKKLNDFCNNSDSQHEKLKRNLKLMNLRSIRLSKDEITTIQSNPDKDKFIDFCHDLELLTLAERADIIFKTIAG